MFRLNQLVIRDHPILGALDLDFQTEDYNPTELFTSVIIGQNATGKSNILKVIVDIFRSFQLYQQDPEKIPNLGYSFLIRYTVDNNVYMVATSYLVYQPCHKEGVRSYVYFRNLPPEMALNTKGINTPTLLSEFYKPFNIKLSDLAFPSILLASSIMLTDKFNSAETDFYKYLGVRNPKSPSTAGTRTYIRKTTDYIIECLHRKDFQVELAGLFKFLNLDNSLAITYVPKYSKLFWTGDLTVERFHGHFENWKEAFGRASEPWGIRAYRNIRESTRIVSEIIDFLNALSSKIVHGDRGRKYVLYDIADRDSIQLDAKLIRLLGQLDLISYPSLHLSRGHNQYDFVHSSSGETHFVSSFIGILSQIRGNGLIVIDEPEISLHPNWQIEYIYFLRTIFTNYPSCHFVIATHSHFILSDLQQATSNVIALARSGNGKIENLNIDYSIPQTA